VADGANVPRRRSGPALTGLRVAGVVFFALWAGFFGYWALSLAKPDAYFDTPRYFFAVPVVPAAVFATTTCMLLLGRLVPPLTVFSGTSAAALQWVAWTGAALVLLSMFGMLVGPELLSRWRDTEDPHLVDPDSLAALAALAVAFSLASLVPAVATALLAGRLQRAGADERSAM
jgi:hypothetical protein